MTIRIDQKTDSAQTPGGEGSKSSHSAAVMKTTLIGAATLLGLLAATRAEGSPILYTTTDLGTGSQLLTGAGGHAYGVLGSNGVTYAFDKDPVTAIKSGLDYFGAGQYQVLTMQNGNHQVGYIFGYSYPSGAFFYPTFGSFYGGWFVAFNGSYFQSPSSLPISDINKQGQVIGTSLFDLSKSGTYAAFTDNNGLSHSIVGVNSSVADNLNNYIASINGVTLTSAIKIDDLGRILALGSNGDEYLLTPTALGAAATVPEPSTALMLGLAGSLVGLRSLARRTRQRKAATLEQAIPTSSKQ